MKKIVKFLGVALALTLSFVILPKQSYSFGFGDMMDSVKKSVDGATDSVAPKDTGAASRDEYVRQQQMQRGVDDKNREANSARLNLEHAEKMLNEGKQYDANTSLRLARSNINNLKAAGGDVSGLETRYSQLLKRAEGGKQAVANAENAEQILNSYMGSLDQVSSVMHGINRGGYQLSTNERLFKAAQAASEKKAQADSALPLVKNSGTPARIKEFFQKTLPDFVKDDLNAGVKDLLGKANKSNSLDDARAADLMCDAVLLLDPANEQAAKMKGVVAKTLARVGGAMGGADAIKNAGKIIFSKTPDGAPATKFTGKDFIYSKVYLKKPYKDEKFNSYLIVDNDYKVRREGFVLGKDTTGKSFTMTEVAPDPVTATQNGGKEYTKAFAALPEGMTYKVKLVYADEFSQPISEGEFELDLSDGSTFAERDKKFDALKVAKTVMKKPGHRNEKLEKEIMALFKRDSAGKGETPLKVVLVEKDWRIQRHPLTGIIQYRQIWVDVAVKKGGKCYIYELAYKQDHTGNSYGKLQYFSIFGTYEIPEANIFK